MRACRGVAAFAAPLSHTGVSRHANQCFPFYRDALDRGKGVGFYNLYFINYHEQARTVHAEPAMLAIQGTRRCSRCVARCFCVI
ncbi:MAG: hypothetical protein GPOALKHO_000252 [Sodalis sp.]|nr:MAG: hypothetical protein GPOALKHO_000252 [Sodalis sp.]